MLELNMVQIVKLKSKDPDNAMKAPDLGVGQKKGGAKIDPHIHLDKSSGAV